MKAITLRRAAELHEAGWVIPQTCLSCGTEFDAATGEHCQASKVLAETVTMTRSGVTVKMLGGKPRTKLVKTMGNHGTVERRRVPVTVAMALLERIHEVAFKVGGSPATYEALNAEVQALGVEDLAELDLLMSAQGFGNRGHGAPTVWRNLVRSLACPLAPFSEAMSAQEIVAEMLKRADRLGMKPSAADTTALRSLSAPTLQQVLALMDAYPYGGGFRFGTRSYWYKLLVETSSVTILHTYGHNLTGGRTMSRIAVARPTAAGGPVSERGDDYVPTSLIMLIISKAISLADLPTGDTVATLCAFSRRTLEDLVRVLADNRPVVYSDEYNEWMGVARQALVLVSA